MRFAFMTWSTPTLTLRENLELAKRLGFDGLEPRTSGNLHPVPGQQIQQHGVEVYTNPAQRAEIRRLAADAGIELCCVATSIQYANPAETEAQLEHTRRAIDLCAGIGAPRLRVFGGKPPEGLERDAAIGLVAGALARVAGEAHAAGVCVCLETHDAWCDPRHVATVMRQVDHPGVGVNWDFAHPWRVARMSVADSFACLKPWIRHAHAHDMKPASKGAESCWIGEGEVDHRQAIELLEASGYEGYLSGEWINRKPDYREHLPRELATLKSYLPGVASKALSMVR